MDTPQRVGALLPTYNRPDLLRAAVLQLAAQSRPPDLICIHQNGHPQPYDWAVADLRVAPQLLYLHTPGALRQHEWYAIPLRRLLEAGCTHFFWTDHDDLYLRDHVAAGLAELTQWDFSVSQRTGLLSTRDADWRYAQEVDFRVHAPGGMSSTMCFNRAFAEALLHDLGQDTTHHYADNVVAHVTMPKFRCLVSSRRTAVYHAHGGSVSAAGWLDKLFTPGTQ